MTSENFSYGFYYTQYILNDEQALFLTKEMKADTFSEFNRALKIMQNGTQIVDETYGQIFENRLLKL